MFLFIAVLISTIRLLSAIQIHLMFLFIRNQNKQIREYYNSNTSHVLIYPSMSYLLVGQYIDSNTSHVLIYRLSANGYTDRTNGFKYISCSYLSTLANVSEMQTKIFKYISCSYLSFYNLSNGLTNLHSNTSHVLIYQLVRCTA